MVWTQSKKIQTNSLRALTRELLLPHFWIDETTTKYTARAETSNPQHLHLISDLYMAWTQSTKIQTNSLRALTRQLLRPHFWIGETTTNSTARAQTSKAVYVFFSDDMDWRMIHSVYIFRTVSGECTVSDTGLVTTSFCDILCTSVFAEVLYFLISDLDIAWT